MKKIYIILMDTKTIPSRIVSLFTMYRYSHVAISLDRKCDVLYSFGRRNLYWIFNGGFVVENRDGIFFRKFRDTKCKIYEIDVFSEQYDYLVKMINDMDKNRYVYKYDFVGIILRYFGLNITFRNKYVCSYFIAKLLDDCNIYKFNKDICFVRPKDFDDMDGFNLIYSGEYLLYR